MNKQDKDRIKFYVICYALIFAIVAGADRILDLLDPCYENHSDSCVEALDNTGDL